MSFKKSAKEFLAKIGTSFFLAWKRRRPEAFEKAMAEAGSLDYSAMQSEFNSLHQIFFQNMLSKIQIDAFDVQRIRQACAEGQAVYMMRNWGQIEYNFFNSLFLREKLPLASHANLIRMSWWMPLRSYFRKLAARLNHFYEHGHFPGAEEGQALLENLKAGQNPFVFLNEPLLLNFYRPSREDLLLPLLEYAAALPEGQKLNLIPLDFLYDRRPGKARKSLVDILFGEKENPGALRKTVLFFRNYRKRAVAKAGEPLDLRKFIQEHEGLSLQEQSRILRNRLHQDFHKDIFTVTGPPLKSREAMIDLTLQDKDLRRALLRLAPETGKAIDALYLESQEILEEIVSDPNYTYLELWDLGLSWVFKNIYDGLKIDSEGLERVKRHARKVPVVLVPSHRSHMDYLLMSDIFYQQKLSMPLVAAGANLSFWPMGHIFRKSGAYFLRRSFGSDPLYPLLFKAYTKTLLKEGYFQEFFIEGTRSRTGKLEEPRTGMLSVYLDCYFENGEQDFHFMPISINYEKVLEDKSHVQESKGAKKQKESFWDLLKIGKLLRQRYGHVYVNFGEAISMKDFVQKAGLSREDEAIRRRELVRDLASDISSRIEAVSVISAPNLAAAALLSHGKRGQSLPEILAKGDRYLKALELRGSVLSEGLSKDPAGAIEQSLQGYAKQGLIAPHHDGKESFFTLEDSHRASLDYYKNGLLPPLIHLCLASWILRNSRGPTDRNEFDAGYQALRARLSREFIRIPEGGEALSDLCALHALETDADGRLRLKDPRQLALYADLISNFVEAYRLCARALESINFVKWDESALIQKILDHGNTLYLKEDLKCPEALSQFLLKNAIHALRDQGLLISHEKEMGKKGRKLYSSKASAEELGKWMEIAPVEAAALEPERLRISSESGNS